MYIHSFAFNQFNNSDF